MHARHGNKLGLNRYELFTWYYLSTVFFQISAIWTNSTPVYGASQFCTGTQPHYSPLCVHIWHTKQWRHNGRDGVSNHQHRDSLLNYLLRRGSKKTSKPRITCFVWGIHLSPVNSPHKWPVTQKMFPFDEVIMIWYICHWQHPVPWMFPSAM